MFTHDKFVEGQSYDLRKYLVEVTPIKTPFTNLLLGKSVKASNPVMNWITQEINENAAVTLPEGADAPNPVDDAATPFSNYTELIGATATVSNTAQYSSATGISNLLMTEVDRKSKALKLRIEDKLINGVKSYDSATKTYKTDGILAQIASDNKVTHTDFTEDKFLDTIEKLYDAGAGEDMVCYLPARMKLALNGFTQFQHFAKDKFAGVDVDVYVTPFGNVKFALTEKINNKLFIVNPGYLELGELIPFHAIVQPQSGSKQSIYLETQLGLKLLNPLAAASFAIE